MPPTIEEDKDFYADFGSDDSYHTRTGKGECAALSQTKTERVTIDADSLRSEIRDKSIRVIDVRREEDYKQNHIPTSVNLPLANLLI